MLTTPNFLVKFEILKFDIVKEVSEKRKSHNKNYACLITGRLIPQGILNSHIQKSLRKKKKKLNG